MEPEISNIMLFKLLIEFHFTCHEIIWLEIGLTQAFKCFIALQNFTKISAILFGCLLDNEVIIQNDWRASFKCQLYLE